PSNRGAVLNIATDGNGRIARDRVERSRLTIAAGEIHMDANRDRQARDYPAPRVDAARERTRRTENRQRENISQPDTISTAEKDSRSGSRREVAAVPRTRRARKFAELRCGIAFVRSPVTRAEVMKARIVRRPGRRKIVASLRRHVGAAEQPPGGAIAR